jgi:L-iditol 2-dehydrogenase
MKAAYLVGVRTVELRSVPDPAVPDDGVVVQVKACGLCGSDLRRWKEGPPPGAEILPGHEIGGVVVGVGSRVTGYTVGDHLAVAPDIHCGVCYFCQRGQYNLCDNLRFLGTTPGYLGGFAEYCVLDGNVLANGVVHRMPAGLSFVQGALAEPCSSVLAAHDKAGTKLGDTILVMGGGPIGCLHVQVAKARGARVIVSDPNLPRRESALHFGAEVVLDSHNDDVVAAVRGMTGGLGVDIVVCANPVAATQTQAVAAVRKGGRIILFGGLPKANPMVTLDANRIHYGEIAVVGAFSYHHTDHARALELLSRNVISTDVVSHFFPLAEVGAAFATADQNKSALKVMITF